MLSVLVRVDACARAPRILTSGQWQTEGSQKARRRACHLLARKGFFQNDWALGQACSLPGDTSMAPSLPWNVFFRKEMSPFSKGEGASKATQQIRAARTPD